MRKIVLVVRDSVRFDLRSRLLLQPVSYSQLARSIHELAATSDQVSVSTFSARLLL